MYKLLQRVGPLIRRAAEKWQVDPRAIAGAIAWEAIENSTKAGFFTPRWLARLWSGSVGLGKFHSKGSAKGDLARQLEEALLPMHSVETRMQILGTPEGAIEYIAAAMSAFAAIAERFGQGEVVGRPLFIRDRPEVLAWAYQSKDLVSFATHMLSRGSGEFEVTGMGAWVRGNIGWLESAVGPARPTGPYTADVDLGIYEPPGVPLSGAILNWAPGVGTYYGQP
jgi:hypothetical protein